MVKLSSFTERTLNVTLEVANDGTKINLVVRPYRWTVDQEAQLLNTKEADDARDKIIAFFCSVVESWDVTDDNDIPIPVSPENLSDFPTILLAQILEDLKPAMTFRKGK